MKQHTLEAFSLASQIRSVFVGLFVCRCVLFVCGFVGGVVFLVGCFFSSVFVFSFSFWSYRQGQFSL